MRNRLPGKTHRSRLWDVLVDEELESVENNVEVVPKFSILQVQRLLFVYDIIYAYYDQHDLDACKYFPDVDLCTDSSVFICWRQSKNTQNKMLYVFLPANVVEPLEIWKFLPKDNVGIQESYPDHELEKVLDWLYRKEENKSLGSSA